MTTYLTDNSGCSEWYTPAKYIEPARCVLGTIDLDPASCALANQTVQATHYYSLLDDGLTKPWFGNVWLNPPYGKGVMALFATKFLAELPNIKQAIVLVNGPTDPAWFHALRERCTMDCFTRSRIHFLNELGEERKNNNRGQVFFYFGDAQELFKQHFEPFGQIRPFL